MKQLKFGIIILFALGLSACSSWFGQPDLKDSVIEADILEINGIPQGNILSSQLKKEKTDVGMIVTGTVAIETDYATAHVNVHLSYTYSKSVWKAGYNGFEVVSYSDIKINPEPEDTTIRQDIEGLPDFIHDHTVKDRIEYTVTKDPESVWTVTGQMDWNAENCEVSGVYTLVYTYNGSTWDLTSKNVEVTKFIRITEQPDFKTIYPQFEQAYVTWFDNFVLPEEMDSTVLTTDLVNGTASFTSKYTLKDGPMTTKATVILDGTFVYKTGWVFRLGSQSFDTVIDYTGTYHLTWDILDTETFYKNNETMDLTMNGQIHFTGSKIYTSDTVLSNSITATVSFRGKTYTVSDVHPDPIGSYPSMVLIEYGTGAKERVYLAYGQESYREWAFMGFRFYGISADESHAIITQDH